MIVVNGLFPNHICIAIATVGGFTFYYRHMVTSGFIYRHIGHLWQRGFKPHLAVGIHQRRLLIILYANGIEECICFRTSYIIFITAHLKNKHLKWSNDNVIALHIATPGAIDYIKSFVAIFSNRRLFQNFTWYILIQQAIYFLQ